MVYFTSVDKDMYQLILEFSIFSLFFVFIDLYYGSYEFAALFVKNNWEKLEKIIRKPNNNLSNFRKIVHDHELADQLNRTAREFTILEKFLQLLGKLLNIPYLLCMFSFFVSILCNVSRLIFYS